MIGFEIAPKALHGFEGNLWNALVYVGQENPFAQKQLTPLVWHPITPQEFPATTETQDKRAFLHVESLRNLPHGNTYLAETDEFQYFLQDYVQGKETRARRLLVVSPQEQEVIIDKLFYESESTSLTPLHYAGDDDAVFQWTGTLFTNKPPVVFGFVSNTFGCPFISTINKSNEDIIIYCDNRH